MTNKDHSIVSLSEAMVLFQVIKNNGESRLNQVVNSFLS